MLSLLLMTAMQLTQLGSEESPHVIIPAERQTKPGVMIEINAVTNGKKVRWVALSDDCGLIAFPDGKTAIFSSPTPGVYKVLAYTAIGDEPSKPAVCTITVGKPGPKPPDPDPSPGPPEPSNALTKKFQEAFNKETAEKSKKTEWLKAITGFFAAMEGHVQKKKEDGSYAVMTVGDLRDDYREAMPIVLPKDVLKDLRTAIGEEVFANTGDDPDKKIDAEFRQSLANTFKKIKAALEGVR